jgi:type IV secretory pathway VirB2 component (pilin)
MSPRRKIGRFIANERIVIVGSIITTVLNDFRKVFTIIYFFCSMLFATSDFEGVFSLELGTLPPQPAFTLLTLR